MTAKSVVACAVLAYIIQSLFNISVIAVAPIFWILLGLLDGKDSKIAIRDI